ncbi:hypothetical protein AB0C02_29550 [Micromonospora sp. NPDC048999]|uniref:hypothetical protein n=1 Tax=Micromonospora sp. NPDC048999 TaxID=3155391 RepID=UPI0033C43EEB
MWSVFLTPLYYLVVVPAGVAARLVHDPLHRRWDDRATSYLIQTGALEKGER